MRISDWSSDVCSSDLLSRFPRTMTPVVQFVFIVMRLLPLLRRADRAPLLLQAMISVLWRNLPLRKRSEEHTSELQSLMRISYAVFCLKKKQSTPQSPSTPHTTIYTHETNDTQLQRRP